MQMMQAGRGRDHRDDDRLEFQAQRPAVGKGAAGEPFHDQQGQPVGLPVVVDPDHVPVVELGQQPRLPPESLGVARIGDRRPGQLLDRNPAIEPAMTRRPDDAELPLPEPVPHVVVGQGGVEVGGVRLHAPPPVRSVRIESMTILRVALLGSVVAHVDDRPVPVTSARQAAVLACLALQAPRLTGTDTLIDALVGR